MVTKHEQYTVKQWKYWVSRGLTMQGYYDWVDDMAAEPYLEIHDEIDREEARDAADS